MSLKCLIVDDEPPAHKILENYIGKLSALSLAGNCYNAIEALNFLHEHPVDIVFLDINMPELSGLDMLKTLQHPPVVILTTAYSEFALEGYEFGVLDYLLKPIRFDRFLKAVNRVLQVQQKAKEAAPKPTINNIAKEPSPAFFFVKADGIQHKVWFEELDYLQSKGNFVQLHLAQKRLLTADTLSNMDKQLRSAGFLRVHKSYIVNVKKVEGIQGNQLLLGAVKIPIGNSYRQVVLAEVGL